MTNRWWTYQKERFPILAHGPLVFVFCVSVISFSALQQDPQGFLEIGRFAGAAISTLILFFQLRVADEFKDFEIDSRYRPQRAVPRGLVSLHELALLAYLGAAVQFAIAIYFDVGLVPILAVVWLYMALMTKEFFAPAWLKQHPLAYLLSHMLIMPLIAFYVGAFDWLCECNDMPSGIGWLLALSFFCGLVLEIGRKIRSPANEREGVETYSGLWGSARSAIVWVACIAAATALFFKALSYVSVASGYLLIVLAVPVMALAAATPLLRKRSRERTSSAAAIEPTSGLVALTLYLCLGPAQFLLEH
jgi:4-hydroxybenzoate polyprenyltransferase